VVILDTTLHSKTPLYGIRAHVILDRGITKIVLHQEPIIPCEPLCLSSYFWRPISTFQWTSLLFLLTVPLSSDFLLCWQPLPKLWWPFHLVTPSPTSPSTDLHDGDGDLIRALTLSHTPSLCTSNNIWVPHCFGVWWCIRPYLRHLFLVPDSLNWGTQSPVSFRPFQDCVFCRALFSALYSHFLFLFSFIIACLPFFGRLPNAFSSELTFNHCRPSVKTTTPSTCTANSNHC